ncbi:MAG: hypothetical protein JXQ90_20435 [Cyclobacteriaceae bacterium]
MAAHLSIVHHPASASLAMKTKKILLARPNKFIVDEMKGLLKDSNFLPVPISNLDEIHKFSKEEVGGVVVSTAVISSIKEDYEDVILDVTSAFPGIPVMLATLVEVELMKKSINIRLQKVGLDYHIRSITEVETKSSIDPRHDLVIVHKDDIGNKEKYAHTLQVVKKHFS